MWAKYTVKKGFTIVELLIVIVVIAILAAISVVAFNGIQNRARSSAVNSALSQSSKKITVWQVDNPTTSPNCAQFYTIITTKTDRTDCTFDNDGIDYQYKSSPPSSYCITATKDTITYNINSNSSINSGSCSGHGSGGVPARINIALNPNFELNGSSWGPFWNPIISRNTSDYHSGTASLRVEQSAANTTDDRAGGVVMSGTAGLTLTEGMIFRASFWMKTNPGAYTLSSYKYNTGYAGRNSVWTQGNGSWQLVQLAPYTVQAVDVGNATKLPLQTNIVNGNNSSSATPAGTTLYIDDVIFETFQAGSSLPTADYRDGNSAGWSWSDVPNASTSSGPAS